MDAAVLDIVPAASRAKLDRDRLRDIILLRIAIAGKALTRDGIAKEFAPIGAHLVAADEWQAILERDLAALADAGLAEVKAVGVIATEAGIKRAAIVLGGKAPFPKSWTEARDTRLIAKALGLENEPTAKLKRLAKPDGLRAAIVIKAFKMKVRGTPSPVRLRTALAKIALARAFGEGTAASADGRTGLSAKAGRALAGRLSIDPKDFRTDARLIAALAAEHVGAARPEIPAVQTAILRGYVTKGNEPSITAIKAKRRAAPITAKPIAARLMTGGPITVKPDDARASMAPRQAPADVLQPNARPSFELFVADVLRLAEPVAEGFVGNRKAFISRLWRTIETQRPHWGLSEIEFKAMLAEAHRQGQVVLANADLKDDLNLEDVQRSALSYRNTVFHYVRVDV